MGSAIHEGYDHCNARLLQTPHRTGGVPKGVDAKSDSQLALSAKTVHSAAMELQRHHKILIIGFLLATLAMLAFIALTS